jgi:hypothetical protein
MADPLDELRDEGSAVEREFRRDQAAAEAEAFQLQRATRSMVRMAWEAMQRGGRIRVAWLGGEVSGVPIAAVGDLIVVPTETHQVGINIGSVSLVSMLDGTGGEGSVGDQTVGSFVAWTRMLEGRPVRVSMVGGETIEATLIATAVDHLLVRTRSGDETAFATRAVAAVSVVGDPFLAI